MTRRGDINGRRDAGDRRLLAAIHEFHGGVAGYADRYRLAGILGLGPSDLGLVDRLQASPRGRRRLSSQILESCEVDPREVVDFAEPRRRLALLDGPALRSLLDLARSSGRAVVITSDHGHILDRGGEHVRATDAGSARHRTGAGPAGPGEIELTGPRAGRPASPPPPIRMSVRSLTQNTFVFTDADECSIPERPPLA